MPHVMIDAETLGTVADAVVLSIGAVCFDLDSDDMGNDGFYSSISIESNLDLNRRLQEDTLIWWLKQSPAAQAVFHEPKNTLETTLDDFSDWIAELKGDVYVWSNGADFDLPMLAHAYRQLGKDVPWKFYNSRCVRTYKALPQARNVTVPRDGVAHNALSDAIYQARLVQAIHAELTGRGAKAKVKS